MRRIYSFLKLLLLIGFVYWLILASILVYLFLLVPTTGESEHLCVWLACTFVLLVVFGAVLFLGLVVVYYLNTGEQGRLVWQWRDALLCLPLCSSHFFYTTAIVHNVVPSTGHMVCFCSSRGFHNKLAPSAPSIYTYVWKFWPDNDMAYML